MSKNVQLNLLCVANKLVILWHVTFTMSWQTFNQMFFKMKEWMGVILLVYVVETVALNWLSFVGTEGACWV